MADPQAPPQTLPADFQQWDKAPATLPANFDQWDKQDANPRDVIPQIGKLGAGALRGIYSVSAPGLAEGFANKYFPQQTESIENALHIPQELRHISPTKESVPNAVASMATEMGQPDVIPEGVAPKSVVEAPDVLSRMGEVLKRRLLNKIPGIQAAKDLEYIAGLKDVPTPPAPTPTVPENWGAGRFGTPVDQWGQRIPASVQPQEAPAPQPIKPSQVQAALEQSLGAKKLQPNVPLRQQMDVLSSNPSDIAEGHTPVKSSAVKSFMYDAAAREFHAATNTGNTVYVYGDVSPEEAQAFATAESKGKAWMQIRNNPLVAKIVNGKRVSVKPVAPSSEDLTGILEQSLAAAKAK